MKITTLILLTIAVCCNTNILFSKDVNYLEECWKKQVKGLNTSYLQFNYIEIRNNPYHSPMPWQNYRANTQGKIWLNNNNYIFKLDSIYGKKDTLVAKLQANPNEFLYLRYRDTALYIPTKSDLSEQILENIRYSPVAMINDFYLSKVNLDKSSDNKYAFYYQKVNNSIVKLYISKRSYLLEKIETIDNNDMIGDVKTKLHYRQFQIVDSFSIANSIEIEKNNGKAFDTINISNIQIVPEVKPILQKPNNYIIKDESPETADEYTVSKYNNYITFVSFKKADMRSTIIEFSDFILVIGAPLKPENGEAIIKEVKNLAPTKPIKYFSFGHHHPHYAGGLRAFVANGITILSANSVLPYLNYLVVNPHTIKPDKLQLHPMDLKYKEIKDSLEITDGKLLLKIYDIGKNSEHANDYLIYYFPKDKLLCQDELVWIKKDAPLGKASARQAGLYNAIKDLALPLETILQSWPLGERYNVKSEIKFSELEETILKK